MISKDNFKLSHVDKQNGHEDYWFITDKISDEYLTDKYMEMCMVGVTEVVYSKDENIVGVKRLFPFNYDVILSDDEELKDILVELSNEYKENNKNEEH